MTSTLSGLLAPPPVKMVEPACRDPDRECFVNSTSQ
jgi:hypothetical protein